MNPNPELAWIGKTRLIAKACFGKVVKLQTETLEAIDRAWLFTGPPGVGKTSLALAMASAITNEAVTRIKSREALCCELINGQSITAECVREWALDGHYVPLYGHHRVKIMDEIDAASPAACNELRTYLDNLDKRTIVLATTNKPVNQLPEQLQSRFKVYSFAAVPVTELAPWLVSEFKIDSQLAESTARKSGGNVRAARADTLATLECLETV